MAQWYVKHFFYFYPRPPGGGRRNAASSFWTSTTISIHALRVEGDRRGRQAIPALSRFLSTPSGWRATQSRPQTPYPIPHISIHALRVEGDDQPGQGARRQADFYPRPPGGGRPRHGAESPDRGQFLSTPSGWRATSSLSRPLSPTAFLSTPSGWRATEDTEDEEV